MEIKKPENRSYRAISLWAETHTLFKQIAAYYKIPMTTLLDQIARNVIKANGIGQEVENLDEN